MSIIHFLKLLTPPVIVLWAKSLRRWLTTRGKAEWEYVPEGWRAAQTDPKIKGWDETSVLEAYRAKWPTFVKLLEGSVPLSASPEAPDSHQPDLLFHNSMMVFAYALALAARQRATLSMLDWGGGIGHYNLIARACVPNLAIDYHCKDLPGLARYGQTLFPEAHFYSDETCLARSYDFVLTSGALHYSEDWAGTLAGLRRAAGDYLLVTLLPIVLQAPSYVFVQRPYAYGYNTEYLGWCLNRAEFLERALERHEVELVREFVTGQQPPIARAPEPCQYRAFLFRRTPR